MNKQYFEKLNTEKLAELKNVELRQLKKVHLSLADDIKSATKKLEDAINKNGFSAQKKVTADALKKAKDIVEKADLTIFDMRREASKFTNVLVPLMEDFIKAGKDLGIDDIMNNPVFKKANDLLATSDEENELTDKLSDRLKEAKKGLQ